MAANRLSTEARREIGRRSAARLGRERLSAAGKRGFIVTRERYGGAVFLTLPAFRASFLARYGVALTEDEIRRRKDARAGAVRSGARRALPLEGVACADGCGRDAEHVHHKGGWQSELDAGRDPNRDDNLVGLAASCHRQAHYDASYGIDWDVPF